MSSEERAVPKTLARAEVTATACRLPSPSLNILRYFENWDLGLFSYFNILDDCHPK